MRLTIKSQLATCQLPETGQLSPYQVIGLVTDLAINHSNYYGRSVNDLISRLALALETGKAKVFFDDEQRPYGYASWGFIEEDTHQSLLSGEIPDSELTTHFSETASNRLWFSDFLCPFCAPLFMLQLLKQELANHDSAYLLQQSTENATTVRRLW